MKVKLILFAIAAFVLTNTATAQKKTIFSSVYTTLNYKSCKTLPGSNGSDDAKVCPGPKGYTVRVYSSATMTHMVAELKGGDDVYPIASVSLAFKDNGARIEWRLANGKPFAVILRVPTYAETAPDSPDLLGKVTGEHLVIAGLKGQNEFTTSIDVKTRNANVRAREAADAAYKAP